MAIDKTSKHARNRAKKSKTLVDLIRWNLPTLPHRGGKISGIDQAIKILKKATKGD